MIIETLNYDNYEIVKEVQSRIDPSKTIRIATGMICPYCKNILPPMEHWDTQDCSHCGLHMELGGVALKCVMKE